MGDTYIKKEDGKEVVYERGIFMDTRIGELHENWDGSKETRSVFGPNVTVEAESIFNSNERNGTIDGASGTFKEDMFSDVQSFRPDKTTSRESSSDGSDRSEGYSGGGSGDGVSSGCFVATAVYGNPDCFEVRALREIRDNVLAESGLGRKVINLYYSGLGRRAASFISDKIPYTIPALRKGLDFLVSKYSHMV